MHPTTHPLLRVTTLARYAASLALILAILAPTVGLTASASFKPFRYSETSSYDVYCVATLECRVKLLSGDVIKDAVSSDATDWQPSVLGNKDGNAALVMRAAKPGLIANFVLTADGASGRTYLIVAHSCSYSTSCPLIYYSFEPPKASASAANAQRVVKVPAVLVTPTPSLANENLAQACNSERFVVDAKPKVDWRPDVICTDGAHIFVQFPVYLDQRTDVPTLYALDADGNKQVINAPYYQPSARYVVDGVYDDLALQGGTPRHPWSLKIHHADSQTLTTPEPTPTPIIVPGANPYQHKVFATPPPTNTSSISGIATGALVANGAALRGKYGTAINVGGTATPPPGVQKVALNGVPPPTGTVPIYDTNGAVLAYTANDLSKNEQFAPVLSSDGAVTGYVFRGPVGAASPGPGVAVMDPAHAPGLVNPPSPHCPTTVEPADTQTGWSRDFRYATQGVDALVSGAAILHGSPSKGLFGFIKTPIGFIVGLVAEDWLADKATAHACPIVQNGLNTALGLSALINALRAGEAHP